MLKFEIWFHAYIDISHKDEWGVLNFVDVDNTTIRDARILNK